MFDLSALDLPLVARGSLRETDRVTGLDRVERR
jgi:hypothetical protein